MSRFLIEELDKKFKQLEEEEIVNPDEKDDEDLGEQNTTFFSFLKRPIMFCNASLSILDSL
jgi:hypothetical protein